MGQSQTGQATPRTLNNDQALFVVQFATDCNVVWDEGQQLQECAIAAKEKLCFNFLVLGQAGSGKTVIVQDLCIPAIDFLFPPDDVGGSSVLIECSNWSQAEKSHRLPPGGIGRHSVSRNKELLPQGKKPVLAQTRSTLRCLILE